jgi:hypothetical protein
MDAPIVRADQRFDTEKHRDHDRDDEYKTLHKPLPRMHASHFYRSTQFAASWRARSRASMSRLRSASTSRCTWSGSCAAGIGVKIKVSRRVFAGADLDLLGASAQAVGELRQSANAAVMIKRMMHLRTNPHFKDAAPKPFGCGPKQKGRPEERPFRFSPEEKITR